MAALSAFSLIASPALAQVIPHAEVAGYTVAFSPKLGFCFATTSVTSAAGETMVYSYYQTNDGRRWHVAGYETADRFDTLTVAIGVDVDDVATLAPRETATRDGDFMLPFQTLDEITGHETAVETGNAMTISVGEDDSLTLDLRDYRVAVDEINACLAEF